MSKTTSAFLKAILGDKKKKFIGDFVLRLDENDGVAVHLKANYGRYEEIENNTQKNLKKEYWTEHRELLKSLKPTPITDEDLSFIE